jgi:Leucine-rich repeat (LRR) protein
MPAEISQLTSMERLIISEMSVQGQLLEYLKNMANLFYLSVPFNNFTGSIPEIFAAEHPVLSLCDLSHNQITGVIPTSIGSFQNLNTLTMSDNFLKGNLPTQLANISSLRKSVELSHPGCGCAKSNSVCSFCPP